MSEKKDNREKLISLPHEYEHNPTIAQRAIERIKQEEAQKQLKENRFKKHWRALAISLASVAVALAVFIPVYHFLTLTPPQTPVYYEEKELTVTQIEDVTSFAEGQNLSVKYFDYQTVTTHSAVVTKTNEFAYLKQRMVYIGVDGFDQVNSWSVGMTNAEFDFTKFFNNLNEELIASDIHVNYTIKTELDAVNQIIQAKFAYESAEYYLEIETAGEAEDKIEQYVTMLIGS